MYQVRMVHPQYACTSVRPTNTCPPVHLSTTTHTGLVGDSPFNEGFVSSFLLILFSEIGDKTFFIAVLLALQQSRSAVFVGTFGALAVMTVVSVCSGGDVLWMLLYSVVCMIK